MLSPKKTKYRKQFKGKIHGTAKGGFVVAAMALYACVARGFGSARFLRDLAIGLVLGLGVFLFFVRFLNVNLPGGWLQPLLGSAGL